MTIRNLKSFTGGLWDWGILDGCFGNTKIAPTDLDGLVERNGRFLVLEAKGSGKAIGYGQQKTFDAMQKTGVFTVIVVWGKPNMPEKLKVFTSKATLEYEPADLNKLRAVVRQWFAWANRERHRVA